MGGAGTTYVMFPILYQYTYFLRPHLKTEEFEQNIKFQYLLILLKQVKTK